MQYIQRGANEPNATALSRTAEVPSDGRGWYKNAVLEASPNMWLRISGAMIVAEAGA